MKILENENRLGFIYQVKYFDAKSVIFLFLLLSIISILLLFYYFDFISVIFLVFFFSNFVFNLDPFLFRLVDEYFNENKERWQVVIQFLFRTIRRERLEILGRGSCDIPLCRVFPIKGH